MEKKKHRTRRQIFTLLRKHQETLKTCKVRKIGLFGSYARNEQTARSDIDFLVEFSEPTYDNLLALHEELKNIYGRKIELVTSNGMSKYIKPFVEKEIKWQEVE